MDFADQGTTVALSKPLAGSLVNFLTTIGADNELPASQEEEIQWLNHFHRQVAVNNPLWPEDIGFEFVYKHFVQAVMYDSVELRGHNIHAFIRAFKQWITQSGVEDNLRERWYVENPEMRPRQLESGTFGESIDEMEKNSLIRNQPIEQWPDEVLAEQYETIRHICGAGKDGLLEPFNSKGQMSRVIQEAKRRGIA